jgi:hypothetical protein
VNNLNKSLCIQERRSSPLLVLDLGLDIVDSVRRLYFKGDGFSGETTARGNISLDEISRSQNPRFNKDLHLELEGQSARAQ